MKKITFILMLILSVSALAKDYEEEALSVTEEALDIFYEYYGEKTTKCYNGKLPSLEQSIKGKCDDSKLKNKYAPKILKFMKKGASKDDARGFIIGYEGAMHMALGDIDGAKLLKGANASAASVTLPINTIIDIEETEPNKYAVKFAVTNFKKIANSMPEAMHHRIMHDGIIYLSCRGGKCYIEAVE